MKLMQAAISNHGALQRGILYFTIACLQAIVLNESTAAERATYDTFEWIKFWAAIQLPGFIAYRAYLDQHISNQKARQVAPVKLELP